MQPSRTQGPPAPLLGTNPAASAGMPAMNAARPGNPIRPVGIQPMLTSLLQNNLGNLLPGGNPTVQSLLPLLPLLAGHVNLSGAVNPAASTPQPAAAGSALLTPPAAAPRASGALPFAGSLPLAGGMRPMAVAGSGPPAGTLPFPQQQPAGAAASSTPANLLPFTPGLDAAAAGGSSSATLSQLAASRARLPGAGAAALAPPAVPAVVGAGAAAATAAQDAAARAGQLPLAGGAAAAGEEGKGALRGNLMDALISRPADAQQAAQHQALAGLKRGAAAAVLRADDPAPKRLRPGSGAAVSVFGPAGAAAAAAQQPAAVAPRLTPEAASAQAEAVRAAIARGSLGPDGQPPLTYPPLPAEQPKELQDRVRKGGKAAQAAAQAAQEEAAAETDRLLPKERLLRMLKQLGVDRQFSISTELHNVLEELLRGFMEEALEQSCAQARESCCEWLLARQVAAYLECAWSMRIPGYSANAWRKE